MKNKKIDRRIIYICLRITLAIALTYFIISVTLSLVYNDKSYLPSFTMCLVFYSSILAQFCALSATSEEEKKQQNKETIKEEKNN